jgi:LmbE family N-acetylglucosaminyl deacetylase
MNLKTLNKILKTVIVIVAHPDDETLWTGGTILSHPAWKWFIVCLCRGSDEDRSIKFYNALRILKAEGIMGDLDDSPEQKPLEGNEVEQTILKLLPAGPIDLIISHSPKGEYTKHIRHEETGKAVIKLWYTGEISTAELWTFAYSDDNKKHYPVADENADIYRTLMKRIWHRKYSIITETYGFEKTGFEAQTTPRAESFWQFTDPIAAKKWLNQLGNQSI